MDKTDELAIERGLKIRDYPGKWKQAKDVALRMPKDSYPEDTAFDLSHRLFLELGAESGLPYYGLLNADRLG